MTTVTNSKGGQTSVTYTPTTNARQATPSCPTHCSSSPPWASTTASGNAATTTYSYSGGKQYIVAWRARSQIRRLCQHHHERSQLVDEHLLSPRHEHRRPRLASRRTAMPRSITPSAKTSSISPAISSKKPSIAGTPNTTAIASSSVLAGRCSRTTPPTARIATARPTYLYASTTNDLIKKTQYGEVTGNDDGTFTDIGTDKRIASTTYAASSTVNLTVPIEATVLDSNSATSSDEKLYYDSLPFGQVSLGNLTKQADWISATTYASSTKTYNAYGLVATSTDRRGYATGYKYDAFNLYVATATNPLNQQTQYLYNYSNGKAEADDRSQQSPWQKYLTTASVASLKSINPTSPPHRSLRLQQPTNTPTTPRHPLSCIAPTISRQRTPSTPTTTTTASTVSCRSAKPRKPPARTSLSIDSTMLSDCSARQAFPISPPVPASPSPTSINALYTTYTYDPLKRVLITSNAVGSTKNAYAKWTTTTTDPNGNIKDYILDAFGNLANVVEHTRLACHHHLHLRRRQQPRDDDRQPGQRPRLHLRRPRPTPHGARLARRNPHAVWHLVV